MSANSNNNIPSSNIGWSSSPIYNKRSCGDSHSGHCSSPVTDRPRDCLDANFNLSWTPNWTSPSYIDWSNNIMPTPPDSPPPPSYFKGLVNESTSKMGLRNLLKVPTSNANNYFLTRQCSYIFYCCRLKVDFHYPKIRNKELILDNGVQSSIKRLVNEELEESNFDVVADGKKYNSLISQQTRKAVQYLKDMKAALSSTLIRLTGYVLFKVFNYLFMSVTITEGQLQMIEAASKRNLPLIFVPLHRSHVDYLFVTWILFNREIPAPIVAAGENLRMPVFGFLLRGLGGFFIKRRLEKSRKDIIYRSLLQTYMTQSLKAGFNLEFFIEGGRTRTGKPCLPKGGLLSVIVDAYLNGTLDDALIVPIAINYDKLLDGNFIQEQLGQNKVPESFWRAVRAIVKVLSTSFGHSRIDFSQPFSLKEFFQASKLFVPRKIPFDEENDSDFTTACLVPPPLSVNGGGSGIRHFRSSSSSTASRLTNNGGYYSSSSFRVNRSNSSLFGTEMSEDYRQFVKSLASHIVYDAEKCQAVMSTNAVSWLLAFKFRDGTTLTQLTAALTSLRDDLRMRKRDTGFSGDSLAVAVHALGMLGHLVQVKGNASLIGGDDPSSVIIRPMTSLPNIIELNYYANSLAPLYSLDAIVGTSLLTLADCDLWSYKDVATDCALRASALVDRSKRLCAILKFEFLFVPPCGNIDCKIQEAIDRLTTNGLLATSECEQLRRRSYGRKCDYSDEDSDESGVGVETYYSLRPQSSNLDEIAVLTRSLCYIIDSYYAAAITLKSLVGGKPTPEKEFIRATQKQITLMLRNGTLLYGESIAADPIRNAVNFLDSEGVINVYGAQDGAKLLYLSEKMESEDKIWSVVREIESFRV